MNKEKPEVIEPGKRNLFQRIAWVQSQIGYVRKDGKNTVQNYDYTTAESVIGTLKPFIAEAGLALIPYWSEPEKIGEVQWKSGMAVLYQIKLELDVVNIDSPEDKLPNRVTSYGHGLDNADKGIYKAKTGAMKYALFSLFQVPRGDDPEVNSSHDGQNTRIIQKPTKVQVAVFEDLEAQIGKATAANIKFIATLVLKQHRAGKLTDGQYEELTKIGAEKADELNAEANKPRTNLAGDPIEGLD